MDATRFPNDTENTRDDDGNVLRLHGGEEPGGGLGGQDDEGSLAEEVAGGGEGTRLGVGEREF